MVDNLHEVVKLLIARMESHPDEFGDFDDPARDSIFSPDRWWQARTMVMDYGTEEEKAALHAALRRVKLRAAHEWMMDELLNGEERRKDKERKEELTRAQLAQQQMKAAQAQQNAYQQLKQPSPYTNQLTTSGALSQGIPESLIDSLRKKGWV